MADVFDYMRWRGDLHLWQDEFNEIDALILSRLVFAPLGKLGEGKFTVSEAARALAHTEGFRYDEDRKLLALAGDSTRFGSVKLYGFTERTDKETETQFAAVTFELVGGLKFIAFRGTDDSLIGWKENFNMSFLSPVPAQAQAAAYVERMAAEDGELLLGGHSKGGNLAMYAAAFCQEQVQRRIRRVYNFDGPGFDASVTEADSYKRVLPKIMSFVPQGSIVGMLLEHQEPYTVVKSAEKFVPEQHNAYSWELEGKRFTRLKSVTDSSVFVDNTLKGWLAGLDAERRRYFIDALYSVLERTNARTLQDLDDRWFSSAVSILSSLGELDEDTRALIRETLKLLFQSAGHSLGKLGEQWLLSV